MLCHSSALWEAAPTELPGSIVSGVSDRGGFNPCTSHVAFWLKSLSTFDLFFLTTFTRSSLVLTIPSDPSSRTALVLAVAISLHSMNCRHIRRGYIVPEASHHRITPVACPGRVLVAEYQVVS